MAKVTRSAVVCALILVLPLTAMATGKKAAATSTTHRNSVLRSNGQFKKHTYVHATTDKHNRVRRAHWREE